MNKFILSIIVAVVCVFAADAQTRTNREWITDLATNQRFVDHETVYDDQGRKVEESEYSMTGLKWRKRFEYSESGKLSRELVYDGRNRLNSIRKFEFDTLGRKKKEYIYNPKGVLTRIKEYEYGIK